MIIPYRNNKIHGFKRSFYEDGSIKEKIIIEMDLQFILFKKISKKKECSVCYEHVNT